MDPNHRVDERFNLNNYRDPSQRRLQSTPRASLSLQAQAAPAPVMHNAPIICPLGTIGEAQMRSSGSSREMHGNLGTAPMYSRLMSLPSVFPSTSAHDLGDIFSTGTHANPFASLLSTPTNPVPATAPGPTSSATPSYSHRISPQLGFIPPTSPALATAPALQSPSPAHGHLTSSQLAAKLDLLASRQDVVFKFVKEALLSRLADSAAPPKRTDIEDSDGESTDASAKAVTVLAERIQGLAQDVSAIRDVLGVPAKRETSAAAQYMKTHRLHLKKPVVSAGQTVSDAIDVDELDETTVPQEEKPSRHRKERSIIDRLDSMEMDFAEFMERVRDPDANVDQLRGRSSISSAKSDQLQEIRRDMHDVSISPRTPSPYPAAPKARDMHNVAISPPTRTPSPAPPKFTPPSVRDMHDVGISPRTPSPSAVVHSEIMPSNAQSARGESATISMDLSEAQHEIESADRDLHIGTPSEEGPNNVSSQVGRNGEHLSTQYIQELSHGTPMNTTDNNPSSSERVASDGSPGAIQFSMDISLPSSVLSDTSNTEGANQDKSANAGVKDGSSSDNGVRTSDIQEARGNPVSKFTSNPSTAALKPSVVVSLDCPPRSSAPVTTPISPKTPVDSSAGVTPTTQPKKIVTAPIAPKTSTNSSAAKKNPKLSSDPSYNTCLSAPSLGPSTTSSSSNRFAPTTVNAEDPKKSINFKSNDTPRPQERTRPVNRKHTANPDASPFDSEAGKRSPPLKRLKRWTSSPSRAHTESSQPSSATTTMQRSATPAGKSNPSASGKTAAERHRAIWTSKPSANAFRDLTEVRFGPPRKPKTMPTAEETAASSSTGNAAVQQGKSKHAPSAATSVSRNERIPVAIAIQNALHANHKAERDIDDDAVGHGKKRKRPEEAVGDREPAVQQSQPGKKRKVRDIDLSDMHSRMKAVTCLQDIASVE